jgi:hypothetical protein
LMALQYWVRHESRLWLAVSGIMAGLAFLSKSSSLFLIPFIVVVGAWSLLNRWARGERVVGRVTFELLGDGLLWLAGAGVAFFAFWPAMWVIPLDALRTVFTVGFKYASEGHAKGNFFLGTVSNDPGVLFYPVTWLLRSSPLVWLGLLSLICGIGWGGRRLCVSSTLHLTMPKSWLTRVGLVSRTRLARAPVLWLLLGYAVLFIAFMTLGEKKQDRYILPVYPAITVIAAVGLVELVRLVCQKATSRFDVRRFAPQILLAIIVLFQGAMVVTNYPYYFTYYNPLMGGIRGAENIVTIGWGEGLDLTADYLNQKPDAGRLRVAAWYQSTFAPYFKGEAISYSKEKGKALSGDYVVFYINQLQRRFPDDEMFRYFEDRYQPEKSIDLKGVTYAVIYPGPHIQHFVEDRVEENRRSYRGIAALLGWDWPGADDADCPSVAAGNALPFRLYWEYLGKLPEERFFVRAFGPDGGQVAEGISQPVLSSAEPADPGKWRHGQIITEQGELPVPADTSPGDYRIGIGFYTRAPAVAEGELTFDLPAGEDCIRVVRRAE